jgi:hypothetical protein
MSASLFRTLSTRSLKKPSSQGKTKPYIKLRSIRPSLLDPRFTGDAWIADQGGGVLALQLGDYCLTQFRGLPIDVPSLNQRLDQVWSRRRHRCRRPS